MTILLIGPPGSGKDTQSDLLQAKHSFKEISTGDLSRREIQKGTPEGLKIKKLLDEGKFVPTELMYEILSREINNLDGDENLILNGVVRIPDQVEKLDKMLASLNKSLDFVVHIDVLEDVIVERLTERKREDDKVEIIKNRIKEYKETITPILNAYKERGILKNIDGDSTVDEVHSRILKALNLK